MASNKLPSASSNQVIVGCVVVVVAMVFVLFLVGRNFFVKISHNTTVISKKQKAESQLKANIDTLPKLQQAYDSLGDTHNAIDKALPVDAHFPQLVASMEVLAGASNVSLANVSPSTTTGSGAPATPSAPAAVAPGGSSGSPQPFGFAMQVKGRYQDIQKFLSNLQLSARPITINNVQLSGSTASMSASVALVTYYYDPPVLQDKTEVVK